MKKFDNIVNSVYRNILLEQEQQPTAIPQTGGPVAAAPAPAPEPAAPAAQPPPETPEPPKPVSSEGLRNLVDLIQRALVISPDSIDAIDKSIFDDKVTLDNALDKQDKLTDIIDRLNPSSIE